MAHDGRVFSVHHGEWVIFAKTHVVSEKRKFVCHIDQREIVIYLANHIYKQ